MMLVVVAAMLAVVVAVSGQTPSDEAGVPINATTSCQFEDGARQCNDCCKGLGYGNGNVFRIPVVLAPGLPVLRGSSCVCSGSTRLTQEGIEQSRLQSLGPVTVAPAN